MKRLPTQSRNRLDERFRQLGTAKQYATPVRGWIRAIREALGMSSAQFAQRLGVRQPSVVALEQSEAKGTIQLATLRRAAAALDCTVVYALVPNKPLEQSVRERAGLLARRLEAVEHSMLLENQAVAKRDLTAVIDEILRETPPHRLWD